MSHENQEKVLNPVVVKLGLVSFFADVASEMLYPVTPIFLATILGTSMTSLGFVEGVAEGIASLLKTYSGSWSDQILRRKPFIVIGYFLGAVSKPLIGVSTSWIHVFAARAIDRTGKGIRSAPRDALISESVSYSNRGAALGWHRAMDTFGAAIGPLLAVYLMNLNSQNLRSLYYWALIPGLISVLIVLSVREPQLKKIENKEWQNSLKSWNGMGPQFKRYVYAWGIFSLANSSDVFLLMKAKASGLSTESVVLLYCVYNLIYAITSPYLGKLSDKIQRQKILVSGLVIFIFVYLGFGFANMRWHFWILFAVYGLYMGATDGVGKALAIDLGPSNLKATGVGILGTATGVCTIFASIIAGVIWDNCGSSWTFIYGAIGAFLAILMFLLNQNKHEIKND